MKNIYVVIVTYNGLSWIGRCLDSLSRSNCRLNIVVIDNGSSDATVVFIKGNYPHVNLINQGKNLGFGQANNIGLSIAMEKGASHVFLLNQDARVEPDTIGELVKTQVENPGFGILSPVHLNGSGNALDLYFADYLQASELKGFFNGVLLGEPTLPVLIPTRFVNAAAWLLSAECIKRTGGFDPIFFHYGEDMNYTQRVLFHGYRIGIHSAARIYHDREIRLLEKPDGKSLRKREWIHFLNQVCDIRNRRWMPLMIRRLFRYLLTGNFFMVKNILFSFNAIRQSRRRSLQSINSKSQPLG